MLNWLVFCVSAWSELANGGSGEKEMSHARRLMPDDAVNCKDLEGHVQTRRDLVLR